MLNLSAFFFFFLSSVGRNQTCFTRNSNAISQGDGKGDDRQCSSRVHQLVQHHERQQHPYVDTLFPWAEQATLLPPTPCVMYNPTISATHLKPTQQLSAVGLPLRVVLAGTFCIGECAVKTFCWHITAFTRSNTRDRESVATRTHIRRCKKRAEKTKKICNLFLCGEIKANAYEPSANWRSQHTSVACLCISILSFLMPVCVISLLLFLFLFCSYLVWSRPPRV